MIPARPAWMAHAACSGLGPAMFYPEGGTTASAVRAVCDQCPVIDDCLDYALRNEVHGIWAGTSVRERRRMRAELGIRMDTLGPNPINHGSVAGYARHQDRGERACWACTEARSRYHEFDGAVVA